MTRRITFFFLLLALTATAVRAAEVSNAAERALHYTVPAGGFEEYCVRLRAGEALHYRFEASGAVDFNLHYHRGNEVFYPVKSAQTRAADKLYRAPHADDFCLMWQNAGGAPVTIRGHARRRP